MRGQLSKLATAALAGAGLLALAACAGEPGSGSGSGPASATSGGALSSPGIDPNQPITLALLVPETAQNEGSAKLARALVDAARLSVAEAGDPHLSLRVYDTGGTVARARGAAERAVAEGAAILLGPLFARNAKAVGAIAGPARLKVIAFSTDTSVAGDPIYVSGFTPETEAARILGYAAAQGRRRIAVFAPRTAYGAAALRGAQEASGGLGPVIVAERRYERSFVGIQDAAEGFATEARAAGADALLLPASGSELQAVGSFMNYHALDPAEVQYLGLGQWQSPATFQEVALKGGWFPAPDPVLRAAFSERFAMRYGAPPPILAALGYDAVQVAAQLVEAARADGRPEPFAAAALTRPQGFSGALGPLRFRRDGTVERGLAVLEVGRRSFDLRDPAPRAFRPGF